MEDSESYTLSVRSAEPVAIKVPKGFQEMERKLQTRGLADGMQVLQY